MKIIIRKSNNNDLDNIYNLHINCFNSGDTWYKQIIAQYLDKGIIIEIKETNQIIGILLEGNIIPCNKKCESITSPNYKEDIFEPLTENGQIIFNNNKHFESMYGIVMLCIHPNYRSKGLANKLIQKHFIKNNNKVVCLTTRNSNINAYKLYKYVGYEHVANIKNKYFLPDEDAIFMIKFPKV